jgi:DNA-directed RNA polymerase subunit M/transcription elongation factor TFIIS
MSLHKIDNVDSFRTNVRQKLDNIIQNETNSRNLEKGIFNYTLKEADRRKIVKKWDNKLFVQIYVDHLRSIMTNLKGGVLQQINDGSIKVHVVAFMTHQELSPDRWDEMIKAKIIRDKNKFETTISASTDTFTCRKCKGNQCTVYQLQTRSSDESMTCYITCIQCGNRWKTS